MWVAALLDGVAGTLEATTATRAAAGTYFLVMWWCHHTSLPDSSLGMNKYCGVRFSATAAEEVCGFFSELTWQQSSPEQLAAGVACD